MTTKINEIIAERICTRHGIERNKNESWLEALAWQNIETGQLIDDVLYARRLLEGVRTPYAAWDISRLGDGGEQEFIATFKDTAEAFPHIKPGIILVKDDYQIVLFHEEDFEQIHQWRAVTPWN